MPPYPRIGHFQSVGELRAHLRQLNIDLPLDERPLSAAEESPLAQLEDMTVIPLDDLVARRLLRESMECALDELPARHAMILRMRYGMDGDQPQTLEYIAQKLDLSRERVRQIEREAFMRLRTQKDICKQRSLAA